MSGDVFMYISLLSLQNVAGMFLFEKVGIQWVGAT